jgi:hypothetical protein
MLHSIDLNIGREAFVLAKEDEGVYGKKDCSSAALLLHYELSVYDCSGSLEVTYDSLPYEQLCRSPYALPDVRSLIFDTCFCSQTTGSTGIRRRTLLSTMAKTMEVVYRDQGDRMLGSYISVVGYQSVNNDSDRLTNLVRIF